MELCGSKTLSKYAKKKPNKRLSEQEACYIFRQVCEGIHHMHSNKICHRDLKLTNVVIDSHCNVKVVDFGFATDSEAVQNMYCGTPSYMSPEIVLRKTYFGKPVDVWALGVVLFKLLTGIYPFGGNKECGFEI